LLFVAIAVFGSPIAGRQTRGGPIVRIFVA
jgi:hypothetical protein